MGTFIYLYFLRKHKLDSRHVLQKENQCIQCCSAALIMSYYISHLQLPNEEDPEESSRVAADAPPPYSSVPADNSGKTTTLATVIPAQTWYYKKT